MYSNFKTGDKIAAVGIGALLATTLGVKALKPGLLVGLALLLKKFWFIILLPFVFIGKLFSSGSNKSDDSESDAYDAQRTEKSGVELVEEAERKKKRKRKRK